MTQEEKAKAYDEALNEIRELISLLKKNDVITDDGIIESNLQRIFPELIESEDERIRKEIVDYFSQYKEDGIRGADITPWIAWLEKQKEQKSVEWSEEDEQIFNQLILRMDGHHYSYEVLQSMKRWLQERMKLLRPWKPSEEQMKALIDCTIGNEYDVHALVRLFAELKKL